MIKKTKYHSSYQSKSDKRELFSSQQLDQTKEVTFTSSQETPKSSPNITPIRKNFFAKQYDSLRG